MQRISAATIIPAVLFLAFPVSASQPYADGALLTIVSAMPEGTWKKVNSNQFSDVWTPPDLRPLYGSGNPTPAKIIEAWSGYAWDSNRGDLLIYGGGHANYSGNDVYRWRARTLQWERAALPSEIARWGTTAYFWAIDGANAAPAAAHTYDNAVFLPTLDRYLNFGGASYNSGTAYVRPDESDPGKIRVTGPYFFNPAKANPNQVGGTTGSHVKRVAPYASITGGNMWNNRDFVKYQAGKTIPVRHVNGCTAYVEEQGRDVVYVGAAASGNATSPDLFRYVPGDPASPSSDDIRRVGIYWTGTAGATTCAVDPHRGVFVRTGNSTNKPFVFWNMNTLGATNKDQSVSATGSVADYTNWLAATGKSQALCALDYDPARQHFVVWCGDTTLWSLVPPSPLATSGWTMSRMRVGGTAVPPGRAGTGVLGKWKYIPGFDVFIGLQHETEGQIWVYKPVGWQAPVGGNKPPATAIREPVGGSSVIVGDPVSIVADASDSDGVVSRVEFRVDGNFVGSATRAPYTATWIPASVGTATVTAVATDDDGAETQSAPVEVTVKSDAGASDAISKVLQRGLGGYTASADVHLSKYNPGTNTGTATNLLEYAGNYTSLVRFAIFKREGGPIPDNAVIESAQLSIYKSYYDYTYRVHRLLRTWNELEATWNGPTRDASWTLSGANGVSSDYAATHDAEVSAPFQPGWMEFDVTARVVAWQKGQANFGWRVVGVSGNSSLKRLYSSEYSTDVSLRPKLEVRYTTP